MKKIGLFILAMTPMLACTDFMLKAKDESVVVGRSMEFDVPLYSQIVYHPRGEVVAPFTTVKGEKVDYYGWTSKYAYFGINIYGEFDLSCFGVKNVVLDGMNEKGLSVEFLWMPGAKYPEVKKDHYAKALPIEIVGNWLLGTCANVARVREKISWLTICTGVLFSDNVPPIHLAIHDAEGDCIVIEFIDGVMKIYDNKIGVVTNAPEFPWQVNNLRNYLNLSSFNVGEGVYNLEQTGQGSGLVGLPGGYTPPERFARIAYLKAFANQPKTNLCAVNLAVHLLNTVDIPAGVIKDRPESKRNMEGSHVSPWMEYTQWIVVKDLKNGRLYYRTYDDLDLHFVDLDPNGPTMKVVANLYPSCKDPMPACTPALCEPPKKEQASAPPPPEAQPTATLPLVADDEPTDPQEEPANPDDESEDEEGGDLAPPPPDAPAPPPAKKPVPQAPGAQAAPEAPVVAEEVPPLPDEPTSSPSPEPQPPPAARSPEKSDSPINLERDDNMKGASAGSRPYDDQAD